ncbi:unnamed protein product [Sphagnum troendelagicum]|uniref:Acetyl-CoA carboxylase beta subunit n=1 Tax=Sphagnum troendelagicum TaxID=128251 RepID=A0ABP0U4R5_9BRYO
MDFCSRCTEELVLHNSRSPGSLLYFEEELFHLSSPHHSSVDVDNEPSMSHSTLNSLSQQINVLLSSHGKSIADPMESQLLYLLFQIEGGSYIQGASQTYSSLPDNEMHQSLLAQHPILTGRQQV